MSVSAKCLVETQYLTTSNVTLYTVPGKIGTEKPTTTIIDKLTIFNGSASSVDVTIYLVPYSASASGTTQMSYYALASNTTYDFSEFQNQILNIGDFIVAKAASANAVTIRISGREII